MLQKRNSVPLVLIILLVICLIFSCVTMLCGGVMVITNVLFEGFGFDEPFPFNSQNENIIEVTREVIVTTTPLIESDNEIPDNEIAVEEIPEEEVSDDEIFNYELSDGEITLEALENAIVPMADAEDLAKRLKGIESIPEAVYEAPPKYKVGDIESFWLTNTDTTTSFQQQTRLAYITEHAYFWIEEGVSYDEMHLAALADTFEEKIYPTNRAFFGSEWRPGIDNDEHLYIIYARSLGFNVAGYFSSVDSVHPMAFEQSNAHETFMLNADTIGLNEHFTYGVLAHEFQHMIHWHQDMNETSWLNEGFSELAALLNGYYDSGFDSLYLWDTDLQLNDWPNNPSETTPHYGAGFLFVTYFMDRFGEQITKQLVAHPQNGLASVDAVLEENFITDIQSGLPVTADMFFRDWTIANFLLDETIADGRFDYNSLTDIYGASTTEWIEECSGTMIESDVKQFGVDYYEINCDKNKTLKFQGEQTVELLPVSPHSGKFAIWSNKGDQSDMRFMRQFDFRDVPVGEEITASYWLWYDIETDYDYLYLMVSEDGENWNYIETPSGTNSDPVGNNYGWGYNGVWDEWFEEAIDLSAYAGKEIWLCFEYVTDAAVNGEGFLLDDFSIPVIDYSADFEMDNGGWQDEGFVRIDNYLPQQYLVTVIETHRDGHVEVIPLDLNPDQITEYSVEFDGSVESVVLVISGATRYTRTPAQYQISFE